MFIMWAYEIKKYKLPHPRKICNFILQAEMRKPCILQHLAGILISGLANLDAILQVISRQAGLP